MPAHCRQIVPESCGHPGCTKTATVIVFNTYNERMGARCKPHGDQLRAFLNREQTKENAT